MATGKLISNGLWFDNNAEEAVQFYQSIFPDSAVHKISRYGKEGFEFHKQPEGQAMGISFQLCGTQFQALNGGPMFKINPSISYFIICEDASEADRFWNALSDGGNVLMPIDKYDWSERYGWVNDKFGMSWQIYTGKPNDANQKICPSLLFVGEQHGRAEEAIHFYTSIFKDSEIQGILKYPAGGNDPEDTVMHSQFKLSGYVMMAMDSAMDHQFQFNEAVSFVINCKDQQEIDYYWNKLLEGGKESACGWLKDQFGVSWQIVPVQLGKMLGDPDKEKSARVTKAFMTMKKFDLRALEDAYHGNESK